MLRMAGPEARGHEFFDGLSQQLAARVAKELLCLAVDKHDAPVLADDDHGVGSRLQKPAHPDVARPLLLKAFQNGDVLHVGGKEWDRPLIVLYRPHRYGNVDGGAAFLLSKGLEGGGPIIECPLENLAYLSVDVNVRGYEKIAKRPSQRFVPGVFKDFFGTSIPE